jgi:hypothetical protein
MAEFNTPTDIGNRALQHCGAEMMDQVLGFTENSKVARQVSFVYGKLRQAELRRNTWTFATSRQILRAIDGNTMRIAPSLWVSTTTYFTGSIVADQSGTMWISRIPNNLGNDPLLTSAWDPYFGPRSVSLFDATTTYFSGELVYTAAGDGTNRVYLSLQSANADVPSTATAYDATVAYFKNQVVTYLSVSYMSLIDLNTNNTPNLAPALFNIATTYAAGTKVGGSDGVIYQSIGSGNVGHDPTLTIGFWTNTGVLNPWTTVFIGGVGSDKWLQIGGAEFPSGVALTTLNLVYPLGTGPSTDASTRNAFLLPAGFLRRAPQNPKPGLNLLGGPTGSTYDDWLLEREYIITSDTGPIPLRFVADMQDVTRMDPMFCEGLAARIGLSVCEPLTQSSAKLQMIGKIYTEWMTQARTVNAIEDEYDDPPDDDLITVRL